MNRILYSARKAVICPMHYILYIMVMLYPFLVWPWGVDVDQYLAKAEYLSLFSIIMWGYFLYYLYKRRTLPKLSLGHWCILIFICLATISTFFSVEISQAWSGEYRRYEGLGTWYSYITLFFFSYYFISTQNYKKVIIGFVIGGWISSLYGIMQYLGLDFLPCPSFAVDWVRSFSFFGNPNFFGAYLILVILLGIVLCALAKNWKLTFLYAFMTTTAVIAMLFTETRGAWLGLEIGAIVFLWFAGKRINVKGFLAIVLIILFIFILIKVEEIQFVPRLISVFQEIKLALDGDNFAGAGRLYVWRNALPLVKDYFWLGSGPDTFGLVFPQEGNLYWDKAHNEFLQIAVTMGVPAMLFYMAGVIMVIYKGFRVSKITKKADGRIILSGLFAACLGYQAHAMVNISSVGVAPFFWIILGVGYRLAVEYSEDEIAEAYEMKTTLNLYRRRSLNERFLRKISSVFK